MNFQPLNLYLFFGVALLICAFVSFLVQSLIYVPAEYQTFLGIPYAVNPNWALAFYTRLGIQVAVVVLTAIGISALMIGVSIRYFNRAATPQLTVCAYCGQTNAPNAIYCALCGNPLQIEVLKEPISDPLTEV